VTAVVDTPTHKIAPGAALAALEAGDFSGPILLQSLLLRDEQQERLFALARQRREACFPARKVEVRSVIEVSNVCRQRCNYCSIGAKADRHAYTIRYEDFLELADHLYEKGRRVLLIQSGENAAQEFVDHVARCVAGLTERHPDMVQILCIGNLDPEQYRQLKQAGADRYIMKFETSNAALYERWKPRDTLANRLACLESLLDLGYQVGSGNMIGLPGQSVEDLVSDLQLLGRYPLAMASCTVFIPGEESNYRDEPMGDLDLTVNLLALIRILFPDRLIPTTSSLEKAQRGGQYRGLMAGANTVTIHDGTPDRLKHLFPIYSSRRFAPPDEHIAAIVKKAHLTFAPGALR